MLQNIITRFSDFWSNFQSDPNRNKKLLLTGGWLVVILLIMVGLSIISRPASNSNNNKANPGQVNSISDLLSDNFTSKFPTGPNLTQVSESKVENGRSFLIDKSGTPVFLGEDGAIIVGNQKTLERNFTNLPVNIAPSDFGYYVNNYTRGSHVVVTSDQLKVIENPEGVAQVVPFRNQQDPTSLDQYFYVIRSGNNYILNRSDSIQLGDSTEVGKINIDATIYPYFEMFPFSNGIAVGFFENSAQQGKAEFWLYKDGGVKQLFNMRNVWSVNAGSNYLMITYSTPVSNLVSAYQNEVYDLSGSPTKLNIAPSFLTRQKEIFGNVLARRCTFNLNQIYCLVKERPRETDDLTERDLILNFDVPNGSVSILNNATIPPMRSIYFQGNNLYFVALSDSKLYKMPL
ncbi:MAG: hypothetical protein OHK0017_06880 [Patescibacteria group bacterium]